MDKPQIIKSNTLYQGDCLDILPYLPGNSIDFIFCDLPFGTTKNYWDRVIPLNAYVEIKGRKFNIDEYLLWSYRQGKSYKEAKKDWGTLHKSGLWDELKRVRKYNACSAMFAQKPFDVELGQSNRGELRYEWIYEKTAATGHLNANRMPMKAHENVLIFYKLQPKYNPQKTTGHIRKISTASHKRNSKQTENYNEHGLTSYDSTERFPRSVQKFKSDKQKSKLHSTQKPLALVEYMIKTYTDPGDTVLDVCFGSNTTGLACEILGRKFIGIEKFQSEFTKGLNRIENHVQQVDHQTIKT